MVTESKMAEIKMAKEAITDHTYNEHPRKGGGGIHEEELLLDPGEVI